MLMATERVTTLEIDRSEVKKFLYLEARLADENRYVEWLELWDESDCRYWVPSNEDDIDPQNHVSIIYDDRTRLEDRVFRLTRPSAHSQDPPARMRRILGNLEIAHRDDEIHTACNFLITTVRRGMQEQHAGRVMHALAIDSESFRIRKKTVLLVNNDLPVGNLTFLL